MFGISSKKFQSYIIFTNLISMFNLLYIDYIDLNVIEDVNWVTDYMYHKKTKNKKQQKTTTKASLQSSK